MIDIPSDDEDEVQQQQQRPHDQNFLHRSAMPEQQLSLRAPLPRHPRVQQNLSRPTMVSPQKQPPARMRNAGGQLRAQWNGGAVNPSASNKMVCLC